MKIEIRHGGSVIIVEYDHDVTLHRAIADAGIALYAPCGGEGRCGCCRVTARGALSEPDEIEKKRLGGAELSDGMRLACRAYAVGDCTVTVDGIIADTVSGANIRAGNVGVAVDIGTTTVAASLVDMETGRRIAEAVTPNPQSVWGADVISRISAAERVGVGELRRLVRGCVDGLRRRLGAPLDAPTVIVGNTTMLSLWAGIDPAPIGRAPFSPPVLFGETVDGAYLPRCVSGYVGADAVASVISAISMLHPGEDAVIVDVGTNGEVISYRGGVMYACAAAAGPALEGAGISCGMTATDGAIESVMIRGGELMCGVIGGGEARGICGSGLVDAAACLLRFGIIDRSGYMAEPFRLMDGVFVTPDDIRALQLAKGAIRAAIDFAVGDGAPPKLFLSGGFGSGLSVRSCVRIGMIPARLGESVSIIGNGALRGAELMLTDGVTRKRADELARGAVYTDLSGNTGFSAKFVGALEF